jgi:hypothetical protein
MARMARTRPAPTNKPRSQHPVYQRQLFPDPILGEKFDQGTTVWENDGVRLWTLGDDGVGIISFKTKMNTVNDFVLDGVQQAIKLAEQKLEGRGDLADRRTVLRRRRSQGRAGPAARPARSTSSRRWSRTSSAPA